jgi:hypothetical protein
VLVIEQAKIVQAIGQRVGIGKPAFTELKG